VGFADNKKILQEFELQILIALSAYSELKNTKISFKKRKIKTSMVCRPKFSFIIKKRAMRSYIILINYNSKKLKGLMLSDIPFNAQVGIIAHEIAHALDYSTKTNFQLIKEGFAYMKKKNRYKLEKHVDRLTISHGFGWQLYDWAKFVLNSDVSSDYKEYKRKTYLLPEEILEIMEKEYKD